MALSTLTGAKRRRFTVTEYHKMIGIGIFREDNRVELIEGEIIQKVTMAAPAITTRRFNITEYHRMIEAGIFLEDDRLELIEGEIVQMAALGRKHAGCVTSLTYALMRALGQSAIVRVQNPVILAEGNMPEPDLAVVRPRSDFYRAGHPRLEDIFLLVEVSDSSLPYDRDVKLPIYARAGVPEVWLADLDGDALMAFSDPSPDGYRASRTVRRGERISSLAFPGCEMAVDDVLG